MGLAPGTSIGHYDVISLLGEGGMGQVCRAHTRRAAPLGIANSVSFR